MMPALFRGRVPGSAGPAVLSARLCAPALPSAFTKCPVLPGLPQTAVLLQSRHSIAVAKELGRGLRARAVFQPLLERWRFRGTSCVALHNLLPFSGLFVGAPAKGAHKITKRLHLDEPHSN